MTVQGRKYNNKFSDGTDVRWGLTKRMYACASSSTWITFLPCLCSPVDPSDTITVAVRTRAVIGIYKDFASFAVPMADLDDRDELVASG